MKNVIIAALLAFGLNATAGNEGPQAVPKSPTNVLVEYRANGGFFVPPSMPYAQHYQVLTNRKAIQLTYSRNSQSPKVTVLKTLNDIEWNRLNVLVNKVKPGALYDANPGHPGCQDAPSFSYVVHNSRGEIKISLTQACKTMSRRNASAADREIMEILNSIAKLAE